MRWVLFLLAICAGIGGWKVLGQATSALHEIEAFILFLICAVFISGAGIVEALAGLRGELRNLEVRETNNHSRLD